MSDRYYRDESLLRELYLDQNMSLYEMADLLDCGVTTLRYWMDRYGIDRRDNSGQNYVSFTMEKRYPEWYHSVDGVRHTVRVHRLLAVAKYGYDAVCDSVVHHQNGICWDNRPGNIELIQSQAEHATIHNNQRSHLDAEQQMLLWELHERTELTHAQLADEMGITERLSQKYKHRINRVMAHD